MKPDNCRGIKNFLGDLIDGERNDKKKMVIILLKNKRKLPFCHVTIKQKQKQTQ